MKSYSQLDQTSYKSLVTQKCLPAICRETSSLCNVLLAAFSFSKKIVDKICFDTMGASKDVQNDSHKFSSVK